MIILICIISVLPWLGLSELGSTANSADTAVAEAMLKSGEWVLPKMPSGEISYDHPMLHWLIVLFFQLAGICLEIHLATARSAGIHCHDGFGVDLLRTESEIP